MSGFHNCRECITEIACEKAERCFNGSSAVRPSESAAPLGSLSTGDLLGELTPVIWKGRRYFRIPGPDCDACGGTGWSVVHGAPLRGDGLPHMNGYCFACKRDPRQFLHDRITALVAAKSSPNIKATQPGGQTHE